MFSYFVVMKNIPYVYIFCVAAFLGLPLASVAASTATEEKIPASALEKYDANKDGALDETEKAAWQADKEKQRAAREARRAGELARYDADKAGKLSQNERAVMKARREVYQTALGDIQYFIPYMDFHPAVQVMRHAKRVKMPFIRPFRIWNGYGLFNLPKLM